MTPTTASIAAVAAFLFILVSILRPPHCDAVSPYGVSAGYVLTVGCDRPRR